jgi:hypothetical protein
MRLFKKSALDALHHGGERPRNLPVPTVDLFFHVNLFQPNLSCLSRTSRGMVYLSADILRFCKERKEVEAGGEDIFPHTRTSTRWKIIIILLPFPVFVFTFVFLFFCEGY